MAHSLDSLMAWSRRAEWHERFQQTLTRHIGSACEKFEISPADLPDIIGPMGGSLFGCAFEDFLTLEEDSRNIVDDYLRRRGWKEAASGRAYIEGLRRSVMSLYEASEIVPGQSVMVRDLVRGGDPVRVTERTASRTLRRWDRIAARLVPTGAETVFGGGLLPVDGATADKILASLKRLARRARTEIRRRFREAGSAADEGILREETNETALLRKSAFLITNLWLEDALGRVLSPRRPTLSNSEGDPLLFLTAHYPLRPDATPKSVRERLATLPSLRPEGGNFWNWLAESGARPVRPRAGHSFITTMDDGALVLGTIELKGKRILFAVNSERRLARARALIEPVLAGLVGEPKILTETPSQLVAAGPKASPRLELPPEEERRLIHASLDRHYRHTLETPVPALGNLTPREAARTAKGRAKVVAWIKMLENHASHEDPASPMGSYDFAWLREELGVADLRR
jgi:hypothetical protein